MNPRELAFANQALPRFPPKLLPSSPIWPRHEEYETFFKVIRGVLVGKDSRAIYIIISAIRDATSRYIARRAAPQRPPTRVALPLNWDLYLS